MPCTLSAAEGVAGAVQLQPAPRPIAHWADNLPSSSDSELDLEPTTGVANIAGGIASAWTKKPRFFRVSRRSRQSSKTRHNHPVVFHRPHTGIGSDHHGDESVPDNQGVMVTISEPADISQPNLHEDATHSIPGTFSVSASEWLAEQGCVLDHPTTFQSKMYVYDCDSQSWNKRSITLNRQVLSCVNKAGQVPQGSPTKLGTMETHAFPLPFSSKAPHKACQTRLHSLPVSGSDEHCDRIPRGPTASHLRPRPSHPDLLSSLSPPPSPPPMVSSTSLPSFEAAQSLRRRRPDAATRTQPQQRKAAKLRQGTSPSATVCIHPPDWLCHVSMIHTIRFTPGASEPFRGLKLHTFEIITNDDRTFRLATRKRSHHFQWLTTLLANWDTSCGQGKLTVPALTPEASSVASSCASLKSSSIASSSDHCASFLDSPRNDPLAPSLLSALPVDSDEPATMATDDQELPLTIPPTHCETPMPGLADQGLTFGQVWRQAMVDALLCDDQIRIGTVAPALNCRSSYQALMDYSVSGNDTHADSSPDAETAGSSQQKSGGLSNGLAAMRLSTLDQTPLTELMETVDAADIIHIYESLGLASPRFMDCSVVPLPLEAASSLPSGTDGLAAGRRPLTVHYNHEHHQSLFHRAHLVQPTSDTDMETGSSDDEAVVTGLDTHLFGILHSPGELSDSTATASPQGGPQVILDSGAMMTLPSPIQTTFNLVCEAETPTTAVPGSLPGLRTKRKFSLPVEYSPVFLPYANGWKPWDLDTIAEKMRDGDCAKPTGPHCNNQVPRLDVELDEIDGLSFSELVKSSTDSIFKTTSLTPLLPDQFTAPLDRDLQQQRLQEWQQEACQVVEETTSIIPALTLTNIPAPDKRMVYQAQIPDFKERYNEANRLKMAAKRNIADTTKPMRNAPRPPSLALPNQPVPLLLNQAAVPSNVARRREHQKSTQTLASATQTPSAPYGCQPLVSWIPGTKTAPKAPLSADARLSTFQIPAPHPARSQPTYLHRAPAKPLCLDMELIQRKDRLTQHRMQLGAHPGSPKHAATRRQSPKSRSPRHTIFANNVNHSRRQSANIHHGSRGQPMVSRKNLEPMPKAAACLSYRSPLAMHGHPTATLVSPRASQQSSRMPLSAHRLPAHSLETPPPVPPSYTKPKRFTTIAYPMKPMPSN
ncbi:hypothetical protein H4R35_003817 [Dimargaris xerosporica]|nr:hypothetical protein H4R35_003817 [Dimargaris xerosporica]